MTDADKNLIIKTFFCILSVGELEKTRLFILLMENTELSSNFQDPTPSLKIICYRSWRKKYVMTKQLRLWNIYINRIKYLSIIFRHCILIIYINLFYQALRGCIRVSWAGLIRCKQQANKGANKSKVQINWLTFNNGEDDCLEMVEQTHILQIQSRCLSLKSRISTWWKWKLSFIRSYEY